jgi:hypothetical protein
MKCKKCGAEFEGDFCPKCGASAKKAKKAIYKRWWFWVLIIILLLIILSNLGGNKNNNGTSANPTVTNTPTVSPAATTATATPTPGVDLSKVQKEYTLTAGYYEAGIDIPAGKCNVTAVSGKGNLYSSNMFEGGINAMFGVGDSSGLYTSSFNGLKLPSGTTLTLTGKLTIKLVFTTVESNFTGRTYDESKAITLTDGNYEAGTDFPEGIYKIVAVSGKGNLSSTNMFEGGLNEIFGIDDGSGLYNNQFINADFKKGVTLTISGGLKVKLIPAK